MAKMATQPQHGAVSLQLESETVECGFAGGFSGYTSREFRLAANCSLRERCNRNVPGNDSLGCGCPAGGYLLGLNCV